MENITPKILKGFRDFLPKQMAIRQRVLGIVKNVFESYGFDPIETPALEYAETLLGKYGKEADKLIYRFKDQGGRDIALRYDLTVPLARVIAQYPDIPKPFKRYQIQKVWRADKPQKGRYREFTQCDVDIVGSSSPLADAEIVAVIYDVLREIGFKKFIIRINSRQVLFSLMKKAGVPKEKILDAIRIIDKLNRFPLEEVKKELIEQNIKLEVVGKIFQLIEKAKPDPFLQKIASMVKELGVKEDFFKFDPILARGLDYYTGPIYETAIEEAQIGSITGGGRFDKLIGMFIGKDIPACGTTIGIDRIVDVIEELNLWPKVSSTVSQVLITLFDQSFLDKAMEISQILRSENINNEVYLNSGDNLRRQLKYADKKGISFAIIFGPKELQKNTVILKILRTRIQKEIQKSDFIKEFKNKK